MNKYAFDFDADDDDDMFGAPAKDAGGRGNVSSAPVPLARTTSSKAPVPVRYGSSWDLMDASNPLNPNSKDSMSVKKAFRDRDLVTHEENLGFQFYSTPWVPPDIDKAAIYRMSNIYMEGRAPLNQCKLTEDLSIGVGLNLYFQFAISIAAGLFAISVLAIPTIIIAYSGHGVGLQDQDIVGLYALTLANIGHDPNSLTYAADSACTQTGGITSTTNQTCITVFGSEYTMESVSFALTALEILQILAFFCMVWHLRRRFDKIKRDHAETGVPSITDYAVHVTNIPLDTTIEQLVAHFSELYQLETVDFRGRPPVEDAAPVDSTGYGNSEVYVGSWVAQCTICTKLGRVVSYLHERKRLMRELYVARARMKLFGPKTPHKGGFNEDKHLAEEKIMLAIAKKVDALNEKIHMNYVPPKDGDVEKGDATGDGDESVNGKPPSRPVSPSTPRKNKKGAKKTLAQKAAAVLDSDDDSTPFGRRQKSDADLSVGGGSDKSRLSTKSIKQRLNDLLDDAPALAAFVCFEYNESFARCLEDYRFWSRFPFRLFAPRKMFFKGRFLHITRAPEPDQIVWENIEVGRVWRALARLRTLFSIGVVLVVVYALFAAAAEVKVRYEALTPPTGLCHRALPQLYAGNESATDSYLASLRLTRPANTQRTELDAQCAQILPDSYYLQYSRGGAFDNPAVNYSLSSCNVSGAQIGRLCPTNDQASYCPCQSHNGGGQCRSMGCTDRSADQCVKFSTADTLNCYCSAQIDNMIRSEGIASVISWFVTYESDGSPDASDECVDTKFYLGGSVLALYLAIIVTMISNHVLKGIVMRSVKAEHHVSFDALNRAAATRIFIATYLNMAIILMLAYGYSTESPPELSRYYLFSGPYRDFDRGWYRTIAFYLVITFILMLFPPFLVKYYYYFVTLRFKKFAAYKEVTELNGSKYPTQMTLNQIEVDDTTFDVRVRSGQMLAWVFAAMTFGAGVPILLPLCAAKLFFLCRMDKFFFCRRYKQPSASGPGLMEWVLAVLPYAAIIRLAFSIFILSADGLLPDTWPSAKGANESAAGYNANVISLENYISAIRSLWDMASFIPPSLEWAKRRIIRVNTFPLFVLIVVIVVVKLIRKVWNYLPPVVAGRYLWRFIKVLLGYEGFRASKRSGLIHPYDLTFHHPDPLRNQEASLSGGYMKYLRHKDDVPFSWYSCLCFFWKICYPRKHSLPEMGFRWEILDDGDFDVKIKTWPATMQLTEGSIKMTGDQKHTFDLICEQYCNSFNLEAIPAYRDVGLTLRKEPFVPIVPAYQEWRVAFNKENKLFSEPKDTKKPKFTLDDEEKPESEAGAKKEEDKQPPAAADKKKSALKSKGATGKNKVVPTASEPEQDEERPGKKGLKKTVSFKNTSDDKKKAAAPPPGRKKAPPKRRQESSSSSDSSSSSGRSSSSGSGSGSSSSDDSGSSSSSSGSGSGSSSDSDD